MGLQRIRQFMWLIAKGALLTDGECVRRHMMDLGDCPNCMGVTKSIFHVLRECPLATNIWMRRLRMEKRREFFRLEVRGWLRANLLNSVQVAMEDWPSTFGVTIWKIWQWRNDHIFNGKSHITKSRLS